MSSAFRQFAGYPVHERGLVLSENEWAAVLYLPNLCGSFSEPCPDFAWELWRHALDVESMASGALLTALYQAVVEQVAVSCDVLEALRGVELDLCILATATGSTVMIVPTSFGYAVGLLGRLRLEESDDTEDPRECDA